MGFGAIQHLVGEGERGAGRLGTSLHWQRPGGRGCCLTPPSMLHRFKVVGCWRLLRAAKEAIHSQAACLPTSSPHPTSSLWPAESHSCKDERGLSPQCPWDQGAGSQPGTLWGGGVCLPEALLGLGELAGSLGMLWGAGVSPSCLLLQNQGSKQPSQMCWGWEVSPPLAPLGPEE